MRQRCTTPIDELPHTMPTTSAPRSCDTMEFTPFRRWFRSGAHMGADLGLPLAFLRCCLASQMNRTSLHVLFSDTSDVNAEYAMPTYKTKETVCTRSYVVKICTDEECAHISNMITQLRYSDPRVYTFPPPYANRPYAQFLSYIFAASNGQLLPYPLMYTAILSRC
jgi:hypothetical protein